MISWQSAGREGVMWESKLKLQDKPKFKLKKNLKMKLFPYRRNIISLHSRWMLTGSIMFCERGWIPQTLLSSVEGYTKLTNWLSVWVSGWLAGMLVAPEKQKLLKPGKECVFQDKQIVWTLYVVELLIRY